MAVEGLVQHKHVTLGAPRVRSVPFLQDHYCVPRVAVWKVNPGVGLILGPCQSPLHRAPEPQQTFRERYPIKIHIYSELCEIWFYEGNLKNGLDVLMIINMVPSFQYIQSNSSICKSILEFLILKLDEENGTMKQHRRPWYVCVNCLEIFDYSIHHNISKIFAKY